MCDRAARKNQTSLTSLSFTLSNLKISSIDFSSLKSSSLDLFFFCSFLSFSSFHSIRSSFSFFLSSSFSSSSLSFNENSLSMNEDSSTISSQNWNLIVFFYSSLNNLAREECNVCNEIKFAMMLKSWNSSIKCHRCRANRKKNLIMISLFEEINHMNSFLISSHLSRLSIAKKLFIARAYVFVNLRRVKDCQYKYSKHVINFMQNIVKIIHRFSSLSSKLQMLVLKSFFSFAKESNVTMSFREIFRVRRKYVEI
jgi:hypothetical protein